jgi:hypothetical protein
MNRIVSYCIILLKNQTILNWPVFCEFQFRKSWTKFPNTNFRKRILQVLTFKCRKFDPNYSTLEEQWFTKVDDVNISRLFWSQVVYFLLTNASVPNYPVSRYLLFLSNKKFIFYIFFIIFFFHHNFSINFETVFFSRALKSFSES